MNISTLEPQEVWRNFVQLTRIPRPSGAEQGVVRWLETTAREGGLDFTIDDVGNVRLSNNIAAHAAKVTLQAHMDMVCEKTADSQHNFALDPIDCYIDEGWVRARGTTLGADCGIGVAAAVAALLDPTLRHIAIDALFTVDEERGLTGAFGLGADMIRSATLINLDSEDEGEIFIGCAGGIDTLARFPFTRDPDLNTEGLRSIKISLGGLLGGHSGDDIDKGRGNAVRSLAQLIDGCGARIIDLKAGNLRNAIPREGWAKVLVDNDFEARFERLCDELKSEYPQIKIEHSECRSTAAPIDEASQRALLTALCSVRNGVISMSQDIEGLVDSSSNLASVEMMEDHIRVVTSQRSSSIEGRDSAAREVRECFESAGAQVSHSDGYPGWKPDPNSELLNIAQQCHTELFGAAARVRAIHAGLECGLFLEHNPRLDMISFGPTMRGVHSPDERLEIASVGRFWALLKRVIERV